MSGKMTKDAYARLIQEDIDWLRKQPACLEREHIEAALRYSIKLHYPEPAPPPPQREGEKVGHAWIGCHRKICPACHAYQCDKPYDRSAHEPAEPAPDPQAGEGE